MNLFEIIILVLGVYCLIDYIIVSLNRYKNHDLYIMGIYKEKEYIPIIREIEIVVIIIAITTLIYEFFIK